MDGSMLAGAGLTNKEADVYLALIEIGSSSASEIIQRTGFHRAVVYDLLERLIEKGLVGYAIKGRKKFFEATNPNRLLEILKEKEGRVRSLLPRLIELSQFKDHLDVRVYKGKEGIKTVFEDILLEAPQEWLSLGSGGETYNLLKGYLDDFHKRRIKNKIACRGLLLNTSKSHRRGETLSKMGLMEIRYLPRSFLTPTVINIYSNKITLYSVTGNRVPFIILIENSSLVASFREYFEWLWKLSKKTR